MAISGLKRGVRLKGDTYKIESILGQGTFGITYLASTKVITEGNLGRMEVEAKVAIKEFFMGEVNSRRENTSEIEGSTGSVFTNYRRKFRKEAENLAKLSHKGIVRVLDVFDENNTTYYVMEFIAGTNLDDYIQQKGSIPENEAISILREVGGALEYMHSKKMLHLDLKPKNIMRRNDGSVCLIDFGLSKQFSDNGEPESSTSIGLGTPGYAPTEQAHYRQGGTFPATLDVYALGATFFKMLTGRRVPDASIILNEGFPKDEVRAAGVSLQTIDVLEKAMNPMYRNRTPSIKAFVDGFGEEKTTIDPGSAEGPTTFEAEETEFTRKSTTPPDPPTPPTGGGGSTAGGTTPPLDPESNPDSDTKKGRNNWVTFIGVFIAAAVLVVIIFWMFRTCNGGVSNSGVSDIDSIPPTEEVLLEEVVTKKVTDMAWESPLGPSVYSGEVEPDSVEGSNKYIPHGEGRVTISGGEYGGNVYEGEFNHGNMEGRCRYTLSNGDTYVGQFRNNEYYRGRYKTKSGEYFEGTFKNGQIEKGNWYDKNGNKMR